MIANDLAVFKSAKRPTVRPASQTEGQPGDWESAATGRFRMLRQRQGSRAHDPFVRLHARRYDPRVAAGALELAARGGQVMARAVAQVRSDATLLTRAEHRSNGMGLTGVAADLCTEVFSQEPSASCDPAGTCLLSRMICPRWHPSLRRVRDCCKETENWQEGPQDQCRVLHYRAA